MTISPERIEAEIAAEVKRIQAWNEKAVLEGSRRHHPILSARTIRSLANDIVPKRLQVEDARVQALLEAVKAWQYHGHMIGCYHADYPEAGSPNCAAGCRQLRAAIAPFERRTP